MKKNTKKLPKNTKILIDSGQFIEVNSIFDYCDYISSCSGFISLHSGQSHLSSAIKNQFNKKLKSFCIIQKKWYFFNKNNGRFIFDNINYVII
jgi:hypothetical protein